MSDRVNNLVRTSNGVHAAGSPFDYRGRNILQQFRGYLNNTHGAKKTLGVTSCEAGTGVASAAASIAMTAARTSSGQVVAIDATGTGGWLSQRLGASEAVESDGSTNSTWPGRAMLRTSLPNLRVLDAESEAPETGLGFDSLALDSIIGELLEETDFVVAALPPMDEKAPTALLAQLFEAVVLVVHGGQTKKSAVQRAVGQLNQYGAKLLGTVFFEDDSGER